MTEEDEEFNRIERESAMRQESVRAAVLAQPQQKPKIPFGDNYPGLQWDEVPQIFNDWWDADYNPTGNPFEKDTYAYWAWAGWKAAKQPAQPIIKSYLEKDNSAQRCKYGDELTSCTRSPMDCQCALDVVFEQPAQPQQEPVAKVCHDLDGHIGWNPNLRQLPDEGATLYTSLPTLSLAQRPHECSRSHPHENMNAMCELRTEIARLTNENARLKAMHQNDEINTYRMTLLCIRDGLQQGMSKSIQKLQAREINDVMGLPSFASYRTSPPAQRKQLTDEKIDELSRTMVKGDKSVNWLCRAIEAAHGIKEQK